MAIITCTECGKEYSDKAKACINCGCPTEDNHTHIKQKPEPPDEIQSRLDISTQYEKIVHEVSESSEKNTYKRKPLLIWGFIALVVLFIFAQNNQKADDDTGNLSAGVKDDICKSYIGEVTDQNPLLFTTIKNEDVRFSLVSINTKSTKSEYACHFFNNGTSANWSTLDNAIQGKWEDDETATIEHRRKYNIARLSGKDFNVEVPTNYANESTKKIKKQTFTHTLLESGAKVPNGIKENPEAINQLTNIIGMNGYKCDTVSGIVEMAFTRGFSVYCNKHNYSYEIEDKGGNWVVTLQ
ncbi:zinc ribbon domain-containing protein [Enterovibrio norvegicus]|uniref:hypothetical protein n=1 Tax=Enterovibrio norvegicus TaxID=188144 RepID=UPI003D0F49DE